MDRALRFRAELDLPLILLGGITTRATMDRAMAAGFQYVAMARALLREPDLVNRIAADAATPSLCIHCNRCMPTTYSGTRCTEVRTPDSAAGRLTRPVRPGPAAPSGR